MPDGRTRDIVGPFRFSFEILRDAGGSVNAYNEEPETPTALPEVIRGSISWQTGAESTEAGSQRKLQTGIIKTRYHPSLAESDKLRLKGSSPARVFEINWVHRIDELPHLMEVHVTERK